MRRAVLTTVLAGCSFVHGALQDTPDGGVSSDGRTGTDGNAVAPKCHSDLPNLRLCLDFEDANLGDDSSGIAHSIQVHSVTQMSRGTQGAALMNDQSLINVGASGSLDITPELSIEMWASPTSFPPTTGMPSWFLFSAQQYAIGFDGTTAVCSVTSADQTQTISAGSNVQSGKWSHVACVYNGNRLVLYLDGLIQDCANGAFPIATGINAGLQIGAGYTGGLDDVHIYASALGATDVCQLATGGTTCQSACPSPN
jgi:hypothetical protein